MGIKSYMVKLGGLPRLIVNLTYQHPAAKRLHGLPVMRFLYWNIRRRLYPIQW